MSFIDDNGYFVYNGVSSADLGVWVSDVEIHSAPPWRATEYVVPARNGTLTINDGSFADVDHIYYCFVKDNVNANLAAFRNLLLAHAGYSELTDSFHPDEIYFAKNVDGLAVTVAPAERGASFEVRFRRDPRRFIRSSYETPVSVESGDALANPTPFEARPKIRVHGNGTVNVVGENGTLTMTFDSNYDYLDVDSETYQVTNEDGNSAADYVTMSGDDYPVFGESTTITYSGVTAVDVWTRWWRV